MNAFGRALPVLALTLVVTGPLPSILHAQSAPSDIPSTWLTDFRWRSIGPASPGGRFTDVEALDTDFRFVLAAAASGGVWKSTNAGTTWTPIFDGYGSSSIGDIKIYQADPRILWVGTGEANNRNSVAWGDGIYKSTDGGQTFTNVGLRNTHQIARIVTHPSNPDVVYVAAIGNLWGSTGERGVFKTTDGGFIWTPLHANPAHSILDLYVVNEDEIWACQNNGFIFYSLDGGNLWQEINPNIINSNKTTSIYANHEGEVWVSGKYTSIMYSGNFGANWTDQIPNSKATMFQPSFFDENIGIVGGS